MKSIAAGLMLLSGSLLLIVSAGCGGGSVQAPAEPTINPGPTATQTPPPLFPKHDFPPGSDQRGDYFAGKLILEEGCLLVAVPDNPNDARGQPDLSFGQDRSLLNTTLERCASLTATAKLWPR